ncbi:response regulator [Marinobacterium sediminicola]|uniref:histidine kinase n=1 Tax=Marinobacterium sediminicola TaxID=518898 RepID=A0ABY1RZ62_9GAMM|nr:response regulator [Marinobacterium sediminicola]ULG67998.1 response regulator [Marinobacterium sediminicola]SMR73492.1 PAS domain S-box-containing protein [Marinobacterium sediminicola]
MICSWLKASIWVLLALATVVMLCSKPARADAERPPLRVVVADRQPPFAYRDSNGELRGLIIDRWALWQQKTGRMVQLEGMPWAEALRRVQHGEADVVDAIATSPERMQTFLFSEPWIQADVVLFFHEEIRGITDAASAEGFLIGARKGDLCSTYLQQQGLGNQLLFETYPEMVESAAQGNIHVFCGHSPIAHYFLGQKGLESQFRHTAPLYTASGRWAVGIGNEQLKIEVEQGFGLFSAEEEQDLSDYWLGIALNPAKTPAWVSWVLYTSLFLLLALLAALAWLRTLSRAVEQRTAALTDSEERFRMLFENTRQAIALIENGHFIAANQATLDMLQMQSFKQLKGLTPLDISPEVQPDGERSAVALLKILATAETKGSVRTEWQSLRASGQSFPAELMITAIRRDEKDILHVVSNDISDRKKTEEELQQHRLHLEDLVEARTRELSALAQSLQEANSQQQALFDAAMAGIVFVRNREILRCNRCLEQMMGYEAGELIGQSTRCWYPDECAFVEVGKHVKTDIGDRGFFAEERELVRKDGSRFWSRMQARAVDPDDMSKGLVGMLIDISAERQAMERMEQARRLAEDAAQTKADFLANMSHEIRTPMNAIIGMTHLLQQTELDERQSNYMSKVEQSSRHLLSIINDILDFSKIEAGKLKLERVEFSLEELVSEMTDLLAPKIAEKGVELIVHLDEQLPDRLMGDPLRLQQILLNFANNAVKFTDKGEIEVRAELSCRQGSAGDLELSVRDTGIGISEQQQKKLFHSFAQADGSTTRKYGGSGLGLAISRHLVEIMGGCIGVESALGEGARFWCTLPLDPATGQRENRFQPGHDLRGLSVLVVDDNACAREAIAAMLARMQFNADIVASADEAMGQLAASRLQGHVYDVVLLDLHMPHQDGISTAKQIRKVYPTALPRVILMTPFGEALTDQVSNLLDAILTKPIQPSLLFDVLTQSPGKHHAADARKQERSRSLAWRVGLRNTLRGSNVLLVEDNLLNQEVAVELLKQVGVEVNVANNGAEALQMIGKNRYDLVLMDMQMPIMDGLTATRKLRELHNHQTLPVVAMTANVMSDDREACLAAGMNDYLAKPIDPERLWDVLLKWMRPAQKNAIRSQTGPETPSGDLTALQIDGVDTLTGLRLAMHDHSLYRRLLQRFIVGQQACIALVIGALRRDDKEEARRLIHSLKGSAGQIGAYKVAQLAAEYEQQVKDVLSSGTGGVPHPPAELKESLQCLLAALKRLDLTEAEAPEASLDVTRDTLDSICDELEQLLDAADFEAVRFLHDQTAVLKLVLGNQFDVLCKAVDEFDYEQAQVILRQQRGAIDQCRN